MPDAAEAIDLGCGTGVIATALARDRSGIRVVATDQSAAAVASARLTVEANGVADRVRVVRDDAMGGAARRLRAASSCSTRPSTSVRRCTRASR